MSVDAAHLSSSPECSSRPGQNAGAIRGELDETSLGRTRIAMSPLRDAFRSRHLAQPGRQPSRPYRTRVGRARHVLATDDRTRPLRALLDGPSNACVHGGTMAVANERRRGTPGAVLFLPPARTCRAGRCPAGCGRPATCCR